MTDRFVAGFANMGNAERRTTREARGALALPSSGDGRAPAEFAQAVLADAVRQFDADLSQDIESAANWGAEYVHAFRALTGVSAWSGKASRGIASGGLRSARALLRYVADDGTESPLEAEQWRSVTGAPETRTVTGAAEPQRTVQVPFEGALLEGEALRRKLNDWQSRGIVEPSFVHAVERVIENPEWLALPGHQVVVVGAATETGPYRPLTTWGASILALERPGRAWDDLLAQARAGASTVTYPTGPDGAGIDLVADFPRAATWIRNTVDDGRRLVLGTYADADIAADLLLTAAADVLVDEVLRTRPDTTLAYLATATDCFAVKAEVVAEARRRWDERGVRGSAENLLRLASRSALFRRNYDDEIIDKSGTHWSVAGGLLAARDPAFALSKRLQRWRGIVTRAAGHSVSFNVTPPSWTRVVVGHRVLAAAYHGAGNFGVEVFDPATTSALMAVKLVADVFAPPEFRKKASPEELFFEGAVHGGLWRQPYDPVSVLGIAAASGYPKAVWG